MHRRLLSHTSSSQSQLRNIARTDIDAAPAPTPSTKNDFSGSTSAEQQPSHSGIYQSRTPARICTDIIASSTASLQSQPLCCSSPCRCDGPLQKRHTTGTSISSRRRVGKLQLQHRLSISIRIRIVPVLFVSVRHSSDDETCRLRQPTATMLHSRSHIARTRRGICSRLQAAGALCLCRIQCSISGSPRSSRSSRTRPPPARATFNMIMRCLRRRPTHICSPPSRTRLDFACHHQHRLAMTMWRDVSSTCPRTQPTDS